MNDDLGALFPITERVNYLNHAAVSPPPIPTIAAIQSQLADVSANGSVNFRNWQSVKERTREIVAGMLGARPEQVAFLRNISLWLPEEEKHHHRTPRRWATHCSPSLQHFGRDRSIGRRSSVKTAINNLRFCKARARAKRVIIVRCLVCRCIEDVRTFRRARPITSNARACLHQFS